MSERGGGGLRSFLYEQSSVLDLVAVYDAEASTRSITGPALVRRLREIEEKTGCISGWQSIPWDQVRNGE